MNMKLKKGYSITSKNVGGGDNKSDKSIWIDFSSISLAKVQHRLLGEVSSNLYLMKKTQNISPVNLQM